MQLSMISSLALAAAMLVSTGAIAQDAMTPAAPTMIGGQTVSTEDLPKVQAQCNTLAAIDLQSLASTSTEAERATEPEGSTASESDGDTPNGTDEATSKVDLALITIEDCKTAGLAN